MTQLEKTTRYLWYRLNSKSDFHTSLSRSMMVPKEIIRMSHIIVYILLHFLDDSSTALTVDIILWDHLILLPINKKAGWVPMIQVSKAKSFFPWEYWKTHYNFHSYVIHQHSQRNFSIFSKKGKCKATEHPRNQSVQKYKQKNCGQHAYNKEYLQVRLSTSDPLTMIL